MNPLDVKIGRKNEMNYHFFLQEIINNFNKQHIPLPTDDKLVKISDRIDSHWQRMNTNQQFKYVNEILTIVSTLWTLDDITIYLDGTFISCTL